MTIVQRKPTMRLVPSVVSCSKPLAAVCLFGTNTTWSPSTRFSADFVGGVDNGGWLLGVGDATHAALAILLGSHGGSITLSDGSGAQAVLTVTA